MNRLEKPNLGYNIVLGKSVNTKIVNASNEDRWRQND